LRTGYSKENKETQNSNILENIEKNEASNGYNDLKDIGVDTSEVNEEKEFENIFSDGSYDVITPDFYKISQEVESALNIENDKIVETFYEDDDEIGLNADDVEDMEDVKEEDSILENNLQEGDTSSAKKPVFSSKMIISSVILLVALGVSAVGYKALNGGNDIEDLENQIDKLYTSSKKDDLKSNVNDDKVSKYYDKVDSLGNSEEAISMREELDTISYYLADKEILDNMNSSSYDLNSSDFKANIEKVKNSCLGYSAVPLSSSIENKISVLEEDYNYYTNLRDEISVLKDSEDFDLKAYQLKVNNISHTPNKQELQSIIDTVAKDRKLEATIEDLKNTASDKVDEAVSDAKDDLDSKLDEFIDNSQSFFSSILEEIKGLFSKDISSEN
jgi:cell division protein FtsL